MPGKTLTLAESIDKFEHARAELLDTIRQAHTATKEAREAERAAIKAKDGLKAEVDRISANAISEAISDALEQLAKETKDAIDGVYGRITDNFTQHANTCLYGNKDGLGTNIFEAVQDRMKEAEEELRLMARFMQDVRSGKADPTAMAIAAADETVLRGLIEPNPAGASANRAQRRANKRARR